MKFKYILMLLKSIIRTYSKDEDISTFSRILARHHLEKVMKKVIR